ncbi:hypothetical protein [Polaribacter sp. Hel1_85]|uniref:hypothetical protein n=1 Tax=Polaribacter sp. Hel1_85 TaxID=1250005 RepID=UPI0012E04A09|nr:hypothetical protein [Polaribacter sp. Hel1_85]
MILIFTTSCKTPKNTDCAKVDSIINKTIALINNRNSENYIESIDFYTIEKIWIKECEMDPTKIEILEFIKDREGRIQSFSMSYSTMIRTIEKIHKLKGWKFHLESYEYIDTENLLNFNILRYNLKLKDNFGNKWKMHFHITEYKDCYYITEPIEVNYFTKEW